MAKTNDFSLLGLPCRAVDDAAVHEAYRTQREKWFLRQYDPEHAASAPERLKQIDQAYQAIRRQHDRRRQLDRLMRTSSVLQDRRRAELRGLTRRLSKRGALSPGARDLLRRKARRLGLKESGADRPAPPAPAPRCHPDRSQREYFRFCVEMAVDRGHLPAHKHDRLLRQAIACGFSYDETQQIIAQVLFASERQRRTLVDRLLGCRL